MTKSRHVFSLNLTLQPHARARRLDLIFTSSLTAPSIYNSHLTLLELDPTLINK